MRIALCLSGYFNSLTDRTSLGDEGFLYIKKNIFNKVSPESEIDVFFHNWEPDIKEKLLSIYQPKKYIVEKQIDFVKIAEENKISKRDYGYENLLGTWTLDSKTGRGYAGPERILSQFYTLQKSIELKKEYEEENNFKYDCVIKARFDLGMINRNTSGPGKGNPYPCQCINFDETNDMSYFYQVYWDLFNEGPADMWFYSNSENMDKFASVYEWHQENNVPFGKLSPHDECYIQLKRINLHNKLDFAYFGYDPHASNSGHNIMQCEIVRALYENPEYVEGDFNIEKAKIIKDKLTDNPIVRSRFPGWGISSKTHDDVKKAGFKYI